MQTISTRSIHFSAGVAEPIMKWYGNTGAVPVDGGGGGGGGGSSPPYHTILLFAYVYTSMITVENYRHVHMPRSVSEGGGGGGGGVAHHTIQFCSSHMYMHP